MNLMPGAQWAILKEEKVLALLVEVFESNQLKFFKFLND